jgi:excinuclease UvrABC nuclease subunit
MVALAQRIEWIETPSEADALLLEDNLIKEYLPEFNKLLRNNSSYVFLKISKGSFPTFRIVRKRSNDGSTYI